MLNATHSSSREEVAMLRKRRNWFVAFAAVLLLGTAACSSSSNQRTAPTAGSAAVPAVSNAAPRTATPSLATAAAAPSTPSVTSTAFREGDAIPARYTCDSASVSPALAWRGFPANTVAYALIVDDTDVPNGGFTHWLVLNLPAGTAVLPEGVPAGGAVAGAGIQAMNGARQSGYLGMCPPQGAPHHYRFTVYGLDAPLALTATATRADVDAALQGHVLAQGRLSALYQRAARTPSPTPGR
jgi:Raf kinase inhibitor-like YbhB/YbcL family protein